MHGVHPRPNADARHRRRDRAEAVEVRMEAELLVEARRGEQLRAGQVARHQEHEAAGDLVSVSWLRKSALPAAVVMSPSSTKTTVKPERRTGRC